ncbi:MAG TPA: DNA ligase, partial [Ramlibacter sp.]|nr:DNA ligase [Ramlibacter sp.]
VEGRYKWVRSDFVQAILDSGSHHSQRPMLPNQLAEGVDLYAPRPLVTWEDLGLQTVRQPLQGAKK